jgi:hypothetical protein
MLRDLLGVYEAGRINPGAPECLFPETLIFNEGWLLRLVLTEWLAGRGSSGFGFLPFPKGVTVYSEGQLYTPFRGGTRPETNTHVDGIVGDFSINDTKSGIVLKSDFRYLAAFEAKLFSRISSGVKNAPDYDQVSRTAACLINSILLAEPQASYSAHLVVVYAKDNRHINRAAYSRGHIEEKIAHRLEPFTATEHRSDAIERFAEGWECTLDRLQIHFLTWEEVLADIGSHSVSRFYERCKEFNA